jgi:APA family basic amino acid/polyamine antiporter
MSLFTKKSIPELRAEAEGGALHRSLGPLNLTALGIGSIIGTGIFVLTGTAASQHAGPALVLSMVIAAVGCAFAGLCYAEFASMIPVAGSAYTYAYATMGELLAWIIGWDLILEYALSAATVAVGWSGYAVSFLRDVGVTVPARLAAGPGQTIALADGSAARGLFNLPAALSVLAVSALLVTGIRSSARVNTTIVVVKLAVLVLFVVCGAAYVRPENWTPFVPPNAGEFGQFGWSGVLRGAGVIFFAYIGFDAVSTAAQEAKNPQRDMPVGILASLFICTGLYIAVALVLIGIVSYTQLNVADPIAVGIDATGLTWLSPIIKLGAVLGLLSVMLVVLLGQSRIFYSMSRDGLLPAVFRAVHPRYRTPHYSTMITGSIVALAAGFLPIGVLSVLTSMGTLLAFAIVCIGIIVLRRTHPELERPFRTPGMPWVPGLGAAICLVQMAGLPWSAWERLIVWLVAGFAIYFLYGRSRARRMRVVHAARAGHAAGPGIAATDA